MNFKLVLLAVASQLPLLVHSNDVHDVFHALFDRPVGDQVHLAFAEFAKADGDRHLQYHQVDRVVPSKQFQVVPGHTDDENFFFAENDQGETVHLVRVKSTDGTTPDVVVGSIVSVSDHAVYDIYADELGQTHVSIRSTNSFRPEVDDDSDFDSGNDRRLQSHLRGATISSAQDSRHLAASVIDVLVVWTLKAECANARLTYPCTPTATTTSSMQAKINLAVSETNQAYVTSGINAQLRLAHSYRLANYVESTSATALNQLASTTDGVIDDVHTVRQQKGADLVVMLMVEPSTCGRARYNFPTPYAANMFGVVSWDCATGYYSFGHEIGHMMGCNHDRGSTSACTNVNKNYGFRSKTSKVRDIMAVDCVTNQCDANPFTTCTRVATFSGLATTQWGVLGDANNNCAAQINAVVARVSAFYTPPVTLTASEATTPITTTTTAATTTATTSTDSTTTVSKTASKPKKAAKTVTTTTAVTANAAIVPATPAPVVPATNTPTAAPVTAAPVVPATAAPIVPATAAPVVPVTTSAPVAPLTLASVCGDGICSAGESCTTCPSDCISGTIPLAQCGNGVCEAGDGETYASCPADCRGNSSGDVVFSCGTDGLCDDALCNAAGYTCTTVPRGLSSFCCGDNVCSLGESTSTCSLDCK
jgi:hypothetical protein